MKINIGLTSLGYTEKNLSNNYLGVVYQSKSSKFGNIMAIKENLCFTMFVYKTT